VASLAFCLLFAGLVVLAVLIINCNLVSLANFNIDPSPHSFSAFRRPEIANVSTHQDVNTQSLV
jgi:hypothetical protein